MPNITENDLKGQIKSGRFKNLYFLFGQEKYLVNHYTNELLRGVLGDGAGDFNFQKFSQQELDVIALEMAIEALPFMRPQKCVKVTDLDIEELDAESFKKLKSIVENLPETTVLIINQSTIDINLKKSAKWASFIKLLGKYGEVVELKPLSALALEDQLIRWCKRLKCDLSRQVALQIIQYTGENLTDLKNEVEKLCAFCAGREITKPDVDTLVCKKLEANVFELSKTIFGEDVEKTLKMLDILFFNREEPIAILSILAGSYMDIYRVKVAENCGENTQKVAELFDYKGKSFRLDIAQRAGRKMSLIAVKKGINALVKADFELKSSKVDGKIILQRLAVELFRIQKTAG